MTDRATTDEPAFVMYPAHRALSERCSSCRRKRETFSISKSGGGSYNRGGRSYQSSICAECALELVPYAGVHASATTQGYGAGALVAIANTIDTDEARAVVAAYIERWTSAQRDRAERRARAKRLTSPR